MQIEYDDNTYRMMIICRKKHSVKKVTSVLFSTLKSEYDSEHFETLKEKH